MADFQQTSGGHWEVRQNGYTCFRCGTWVPNNTFHTCPSYAVTPPVVVYPTCKSCMALLYAGTHTVTHHTSAVEVTERYCGACCPTCNPKGAD